MSSPAAWFGARRGLLRFVPAGVAAVPLLAVAVWVAAAAALPAYQVAGAPGLLAAAAGGAAVVSLAASLGLRLPAAAAYGMSLVGLVVLLAAVSGADPGAAAAALAHGPNRVLTETLPLSGGPATLSPLIVLTWVAAGAAAELGIRSGGDRRGLLALGIPAFLYVACFAVASSAPRHDRFGAPVLLVLLALTAALLGPAVTAAGPASVPAPAPMSGPDDPLPPSPYRGLLAGLALVAVLAAVLTVAAPAVPGLTGRPAALHRTPPLAVPSVVDPVGVMAHLRDAHPHRPPVPEFTVRTDGPSTGYMAVADLGRYNGDEWRFKATFQPTGGRVPGPPAGSQAVGDTPVSQEVSVAGKLPVPLLPALDRPVSVVGPAVAADPATGMLLPLSGAPVRSYTVVSRAPTSTLAGLPAADGVDPTLAEPTDLAIPPNTSGDLATTLRFLTGLAGQRPAATVAFLQRVMTVLHSAEKRIDPGAAPPAGPGPTTTVAPPVVEGTSLSEVINAVTVNRAATPEQFATFFAMVARYLGVPARVVTGFRLADSSSGAPLPAGTYRVTNRQAWAWVEVPVAGVGWVVADPTPDGVTPAAAPPPESVQAPSTTVPPRPASAVPRNQITGGHALAPRVRFHVASRDSLPAWVVALMVFAGFLLAVGLAGPGQAAARRAWRRRARRSSDPAELAVGAWLELLDGLDRAGVPAGPGVTNAQIAADMATHFGPDLAPPAASLATLADRAVCCRSDAVDIAAATGAWETQRSLRRQMTATLDRRARLWYLLSVGRAPRNPSGPADLPSRYHPSGPADRPSRFRLSRNRLSRYRASRSGGGDR